MNRELLRRALAALTSSTNIMGNFYPNQCSENMAVRELIKAELAKPEPEPVAWMNDDADVWVDTERPLFHPEYDKPLYTSPYMREPLSEEVIGHILDGAQDEEISFIEFARAIEKAHGIGQ
jgi:hypothetical protein